MDRESEYLLHLLGAFAREQEPNSCPQADWDRLQRLAHIHNVSGILGYMAMSWPICPDPQRLTQLRRLCHSTLGAYTRRGVLAQQLSDRLSEAGISHIIMKGFVLRRLYPVAELRTYGDVDLVIRPEDRQRCHQRMLELGYRVKNDWEPVYSYRSEAEYYEIHTELLEVDVSDRADYRGYFRGLWEHTAEVRGCCLEFTPEFHFLYLLTHIAKHVVGSGAGVRMYLDLALLLRHYEADMDWEWIRGELKVLSLEAFCAVALEFVRAHWGIACPLQLPPVPERTLEEFTRITLAGGIFGKEARDSGTNSLAQECRDGGAVSRGATLTRRLFPPAEAISSRYTYLQDKPWLLPAAWVHRLVRTRRDWQGHAREAGDILSADKEEVMRLNRFFREIGL